MVRVVLAEGEGDAAARVVVDAAGGNFGRGAHVHPTLECVAKAERGLSRSFRRPVSAPQAELAGEVSVALRRRAEALLVTAHRTRKIELGADGVKRMLREQPKRAALVVVAGDAGSVALSDEVRDAVAAGRAIAWTSRSELGALLGRTEVALVAITDERIASAFAVAARMMFQLLPGTGAHHTPGANSPDASVDGEGGDACRSPEVR